MPTWTATYEAGILAILPWRPKVVLLSEPSGLTVLTSKGAPLFSSPQRASSSSKPSSQPRPPAGGEVDERRVNRPVGDRRVPAQPVAVVPAFP